MSTCARNLPQHFNGCTCTLGGGTTTAEAPEMDLVAQINEGIHDGVDAPPLPADAEPIPHSRVNALGHAVASALQGQIIERDIVRDEARTGTTILFVPGQGFRAYSDSAWTEPDEQPMLPWSPPPTGEVVAKVHRDGSYEYPNATGPQRPVSEALEPVTKRIDTHLSSEDAHLIASAAESLHSGDSGVDHRRRTYDLATHAMLGAYIQQRHVNGAMHPMLARAAADMVHDDARRREDARVFDADQHARLRLLLGLNKTTAKSINEIEG
jgi:hypothetical protein